MLNDTTEMPEPILQALNRVGNFAKTPEERVAVARLALECYKAGYSAGVKDAVDDIRLLARGEM